jgi:AbrB family looped-hinge helix DNA binding protein
MDTEKAQLSENGRIVIPAPFRKALGLKGGDVLTVRMDETGLHLQTRKQALIEGQKLVRKYISADRRLSDELIAERRIEARREAAGE